MQFSARITLWCGCSSQVTEADWPAGLSFETWPDHNNIACDTHGSQRVARVTGSERRPPEA